MLLYKKLLLMTFGITLVFGNSKGIPVHSANRLQRWAATLLGYDFRIEYQKSTDFGQADVLSSDFSGQHQSKK
jgi:hypothetical protein